MITAKQAYDMSVSKFEVEKVLKLLHDNWFKCKLYYNEFQFVDNGLQISWGME